MRELARVASVFNGGSNHETKQVVCRTKQRMKGLDEVNEDEGYRG